MNRKFTASTWRHIADPPVGLTVTAESNVRLDLAWALPYNSMNPAGVTVERSLDGVTGWGVIATLEAGSTGYEDTTLSTSSTRFYRVQEFNNNGTGPYSEVASGTTFSLGQTATRATGDFATIGEDGTAAFRFVDSSIGSADLWPINDLQSLAVIIQPISDSETISLTEAGSSGVVGADLQINGSDGCTILDRIKALFIGTTNPSSADTVTFTDAGSAVAIGGNAQVAANDAWPFVEASNRANSNPSSTEAVPLLEQGSAVPAVPVTGYPTGYIKPPAAYVYAAGARTDHPRLLLTTDTLALYRSWAVNTNPRWTDLSNAATQIDTNYSNGSLYANDPGSNSGGAARMDAARLFAFMSLVDPDPLNRTRWGTKAYTVLMDLINIMVQGAAPGVPFRDPAFSTGDAARSVGEALALCVDWIYPLLSGADKAKIRQVFLRWNQERMAAQINLQQHGVYYNVALRAAGNALRQAGNNYMCCHGRNILFTALAFDPADDVPANPGGSPSGYDTVPSGALAGMVNGEIGSWIYQREWFEQHDTRGGFSQEGVEYGTSSSLGACALSQAALATTRHDDEGTYGTYAGWGGHQFWHDDFPLGFCHSFSSVLGTVPNLPYSEYLPLCYGDVQTYSPAEGTQLFAGICLRARAHGDTALDQMAQWWMANFLYQGPSRLSALLRAATVYGCHLAINAFLVMDPTATISDPRPALALDVYGAGLGRMISRDQWGANGRSVDTICQWGGTDHQQADAGAVGFWRKGEWLSKNCCGYGVIHGCSDRKNILSLENTPDPNDHWYSIDNQQHGSQYIYTLRGDPVSVQSFPAGCAYQQMVTTENYNEQTVYTQAQDILHASRSLFYLKPDVIFLYDRARHAALNRYSRLRLNSQNTPTIAGSVSTATTPGGQKLFITSLLPAGATVTATGIPSAATDTPADFEPMAFQTVVEDTSNSQSVRFLTILEGADSGGSRTVPALVQGTAGDAFDGAKVGTTLVMFKGDITAAFTGLTFTMPGGTTAAYVTGLAPGAAYTVGVVGQVVTVSPTGASVADLGGVLKVI